MITCENVGELHYAKFLWLDERVYASEVSFQGRPMIAIRALRGGDWLRAHKGSTIAPLQLLRWVRARALRRRATRVCADSNAPRRR